MKFILDHLEGGDRWDHKCLSKERGTQGNGCEEAEDGGRGRERGGRQPPGAGSGLCVFPLLLYAFLVSCSFNPHEILLIPNIPAMFA